MWTLVTLTVRPVIILMLIAVALSVLSSVIYQNDVIIWNSHSWNCPDSLSAPSLSPYEQALGTDNDCNIYK